MGRESVSERGGVGGGEGGRGKGGRGEGMGHAIHSCQNRHCLSLVIWRVAWLQVPVLHADDM
jgi:hypothetical protein